MNNKTFLFRLKAFKMFVISKQENLTIAEEINERNKQCSTNEGVFDLPGKLF